MWNELLSSIQTRRWPGALYYKPACILAVLDGLDACEIDAKAIDPEVVFERFRRLVSVVAPTRAEFGWRPFWHLSNDGAWGFFKGTHRVVPEDYGRERKPNSKRELLNRIDRVSVPCETLAAWTSPKGREALRGALIDMLQRDRDSACVRLATVAKQKSIIEGRRAAATERASREQGFLANPEARRAIEVHAMRVVTAYLKSEGWTVEDVSRNQPYDLHCTRGEEQAYVEVKGTTSDGDKIFLTAGEVAFAACHINNMALAVVSEIKLSCIEDTIAVIDGKLRVIWGWCIASTDLTPVSYSYALPHEMDERK